MKNAINYSEKFEQSLREIDQFVAQKVESLVDEPFQMPNSMLFAVDYVRGEVPAIKKIAESADVYDMLDDTLNAVLVWETGYNGWSVVTTGWASPIKNTEDDEIAPSKHPLRRRVRLMSMMHNGKMGSSIRFSDEQSVTYDEGNASGTLAMVMRDFDDVVRAMKVSASKENERQLP